jgi:hypothetical protein
MKKLEKVKNVFIEGNSLLTNSYRELEVVKAEAQRKRDKYARLIKEIEMKQRIIIATQERRDNVK